MTTTDRSELRRLPERGTREWQTIREILDAGTIASVGFSVDGQPFVIPMLYGRNDQSLILHGSSASRIANTLAGGAAVCATVTHVDGLVLARSAFHHSMNYRSVVMFGTARVIEDPRRKIEALRILSEHMLPGRWADVRGPTKQELAITMVLEMPIDEATAKVRTGPPGDDEADYARRCWAGVLPLSVRAGDPVADDRLASDIEAPAYMTRT